LLEINNLCASYYPFGSTQDGLSYIDNTLKDNDLKNKYLFGGKEQDDKTGFYEYSFRQYDSWLGRWHVVDPSAEWYATQSPYHFAGNNPVNNYEVNGADYYMSPFDSKKWSDDDDGIGDMGDALGSDGGGGGLPVGNTLDGMNIIGDVTVTSYQHTPYVYPNRNPLNGYSVPGETHGEGWMPRDMAGGGSAPNGRVSGKKNTPPDKYGIFIFDGKESAPYEYGETYNGNSDFIENTWEALDFLYENLDKHGGDDLNIVKTLDKSKCRTSIRYSRTPKNFNMSKKPPLSRVYWNPGFGVITKHTNNGTDRMPPVFTLLHELNHAYNNLLVGLFKTTKFDFINEDELIVQGLERFLSFNMGFGYRNVYDDIIGVYDASSPFSIMGEPFYVPVDF
jgi:RHS repeat-associated protein